MTGAATLSPLKRGGGDLGNSIYCHFINVLRVTFRATHEDYGDRRGYGLL